MTQRKSLALRLALLTPLIVSSVALIRAQEPIASPESQAQGLRAADSPRTDLSSKATERLQEEVRHELVMLPFYGVFDNLEYSINSDTVNLMGQVTRPTLKSDAESAVKRIEGVENVNNQIEVLPLSSSDDQIRLATYRAIYGTGALERYALQAVPPIHIIVKSGHVTLTGVVSNSADKTMAELKAKSVSGVFSVTSKLRTER